MLITLLCIS